MARPIKNNADYFTHDSDMRNDVKIRALRRKYKHAGYAVWCFTLEVLTDSDYFEITWDDINKELLSADFDVLPEELSEIIDYCAKLGLLRVEHGKLYSPTHQQRFSSLLKKRERDNVYNKTEKEVIGSENPTKTQEKKIIKAEKKVIANENDIVKESRVKESKVEKSKDKYPYQDIADLWNSSCPTLPAVIKLSQARKDKIHSRLEEFGDKRIETLKTLFAKVAASKFLRGENKNEWKATFDWLFENSKNWVKVLEGNYDNKGEQKQTGNVTLGCDERIESGRRTYGSGKATIPLEAPPRPSERYAWDCSTQTWIML